jgi:hypothetical protein
VAAFVSTTYVVSGWEIDASWVGGLVVIATVWQLLRPGRVIAMMAVAGVLAALWALVLQAIGTPRSLGIPLAVVVPIVSAYLSGHRARFAPPFLRDEAMFLILILAVVVAAASSVSQGWHSAIALNVTAEGRRSASVPLWMVSFVVVSLTCGGLWSMWRRG